MYAYRPFLFAFLISVQRYEKFGKVGCILQGKFASHHRWRIKVTQKAQIAQIWAITDGWYMGPAEIAEMAEILEPSQMATYWNRLKARNCSKFDSKLFKIFGAITDGGDSTEMYHLGSHRGM